MSNVRNLLAAGMLGLFAVSGTAVAEDDGALEKLKIAVSAFTGVQYSMMGDVVYLHGTTDNIPELSNIVQKLMSIDGITEVRTNISKQ